jgi:hypothetical protein
VIDSLRDLAAIYPGMRIGQLLAMAATLASDDVIRDVAEIPDEQLSAVVNEHVARRKGLPIRSGADDSTVGAIQQLQTLAQRQGDEPLGAYCVRRARVVGTSLYDIEDDDLVGA